jgi:hypothetical protein
MVAWACLGTKCEIATKVIVNLQGQLQNTSLGCYSTLFIWPCTRAYSRQA